MDTMKKIIHWTARVLAIFLAAFLALFIAEGFGPDFTWVDSLMHGLLALIAAGLAWLGWTKPRIGGCAYLGVAAAFLVMILLQGMPMGVLNPVFILLAVIGGLFVADGILGF